MLKVVTNDITVFVPNAGREETRAPLTRAARSFTDSAFVSGPLASASASPHKSSARLLATAALRCQSAVAVETLTHKVFHKYVQRAI